LACLIILVALGCPAAARACGGGSVLDSYIDTADVPKPLLHTFERAFSEEWVVFGGGFHQNYYYLPATIRRTSRGTKTVWGVNLPGADDGNWVSARAEVMEQRANSGGTPEPYARYLLTKIEWEIDCAGRRLRMLRLIDCDEAGNVIWSGRY